jgi:hypothetical protein
LDDFNKARGLDPAGDAEEKMQAARRGAEKGLR